MCNKYQAYDFKQYIVLQKNIIGVFFIKVCYIK